MRINDILIESQQQELEEGPLGDLGRGAAKVVGGIAKGAGMVAGIGKGMSSAYQKGKAQSAAHIAGDVPDEEDPEYSKEYSRLTQQPAGAAKVAAPAKSGGFMGGLKKALGGAQGDAAGGTPASIQQQIAQKQQEIKDLQAKLKPAGNAAPAAAKPAAPAEPTAQVEPTMEPEAPAAAPAAKAAPSFNNQTAGGKQTISTGGKFNPATMKNEPGTAAPTGIPATQNAATAAPAKRTGGKVPGQVSQTPTAVKKRDARAAAKGSAKPAGASQAEIDADRERIMGNVSDSRIRSGKVVAESYRSIFKTI